jgi:NosR/NirI family nitrous oxide reductase transcriptional regulator
MEKIMFHTILASLRRALLPRSRRRLVVAILALLTLASNVAWAGSLKKEDIERRFGRPYQVLDKLSDIPAWPITSALEQNAGPVAYAFESVDLAPLPGFEGTPMNFLVSIDRKGNFIGVEVLEQREPVFTFRDLGGKGDSLLREFIAQYTGRNLRQPFLISTGPSSNRSG